MRCRNGWGTPTLDRAVRPLRDGRPPDDHRGGQRRAVPVDWPRSRNDQTSPTTRPRHQRRPGRAPRQPPKADLEQVLRARTVPTTGSACSPSPASRAARSTRSTRPSSRPSAWDSTRSTPVDAGGRQPGEIHRGHRRSTARLHCRWTPTAPRCWPCCGNAHDRPGTHARRVAHRCP